MPKNSIALESGWQVAQLAAPYPEGQAPGLAGLRFIPAKVPRSIHYDLMAAGLLGNVYGSDEAARAATWVSRADWVYRAAFQLSPQLREAPRLFLCLDCVDTFSDVFVNGVLVGATDNMFIPYRFPLPASILREGENEVLVHIKGHRRMVAHKAPESVQRIAADGKEDLAAERALVRRYQRSYSSDLTGFSATLQGIGLVRGVRLEACPAAYLEECVFSVRSAQPQEAAALVEARVDGGGDACGPLTVKATLLSPDGSPVAEASAPVDGGGAAIPLTVERPQLWWPVGYGAPILYTLRVSLLAQGRELDSDEKQVGLRQVALAQELPSGRQTFQLLINDTPITVFGGNIMPVDMLNAGGSREEYQNLLRLCQNAHINLVRLWGGGTEEPAWFYDMCDRMGILLWQDARLHSNTYPDYDEAFCSQVLEETAGMLRRLRSHPSFAVFCGGNEQQEGWDAWSWRTMHDRFYGARLIYDKLPALSREICPEIPYIPNSPFGKKLSQSPVDGDTHTWGNFYNATEDPLFVTETCWYVGTHSRLETLEPLMGLERGDFTGLGWQRKWKERTTLPLYNVNQFTEYHTEASLESYLHGLEIEQLWADYTALSILRCRSSSCTGIVYWPFNKGGPMMPYGCVDYGGRPLMPYYLLPRLFAPVYVSAYRDVDDIRVIAANAGAPVEATLTVTHFESGGKVLGHWRQPVTLQTGNAQRLLSVEGLYKEVVNRWREAVHVSLEAEGRLLGEDTLFFCPLFEFEVQEPGLAVQASRTGEGTWQLEVKSGAFVKLLELEAGFKAMFSQDYFPLMPGERRVITLTALEAVPPRPLLTARALDCAGAVEIALP